MNKSSVKWNFLMNIVLTVSSFIFPLITFPYISRVLSPIGTGKISFATSVIAYFISISQLGIPVYGIRVCAQARDDREKLTRTVHELLFINLITTFIAYVVLAVLVVTISKLYEEKILYAIVSTMIVLNAVGVEWLYKALEQYTYITVRSVIFKCISVFAMFALVHSKKDYIIYAAISVFASSASYILNLINVHKYIDIKPVWNYDLKRHLKPIAVFFVMACATTIYTNLDNVMLGFMKSDEAVGYYSVAIKVKTILVSVVTALGTVMLPRVSYYIEKGKQKEFYLAIEKAIKFVFIFSCPLLVYFIIYAKECILILAGKEYAASVLPMQILMPTLLFIGLTNVFGIQILVPTGRENVVMLSGVIGVIIDAIINGLCIPNFSYIGAAIGTLFAEIFVLIVQYIYIREEVKKILKQINYIQILTAIVLSGIASYWIKYLSLNSIITISLSSIIYFGVYLIYLLFRKDSLMTEIMELFIGKIEKLK